MVEPVGASGRWRNSSPWFIAAVAAAVALYFGAEAGDTRRALDREVNRQVDLQARLAESDQLLEDILLGDGDQIVLTSTVAPEPGVRVYWNRQRNVMVVHAYELYPQANNRVYQLWFVSTDGSITASETFRTATDGHGLKTVSGPIDPGALSALAVSIEPAGGSEQPTSDPILFGTVGGG